MDFGLSDDEALFRQSVREFAAAVVAPVAAAADTAGAFPADTLREAAAIGLFGMLVPEADGGAALDTLRYVLALEEVARASGALAAMLNTHNALVCLPLAEAAPQHTRARWLPALASGELLGAACPPAPQPSGGPPAPTVQASPTDGAWELRGPTAWVTNASETSLFVAFAATPATTAPEMAVFVVSPGTPGVKLSPFGDKLGLRAAPTADVTFDGCHVPHDACLDNPEIVSPLANRALDLARLGSAAQALGIGQAALDAALAYAQERHQFGRPIGQFDGLRAMLADVYLAMESARLLTYRAAWLRDRGQPWATATALAKLQAGEAATLATTKAIQVHGGYGYMEESAVQRYFRDAKVTQAAEESPRIQRAAIAAHILPHV